MKEVSYLVDAPLSRRGDGSDVQRHVLTSSSLPGQPAVIDGIVVLVPRGVVVSVPMPVVFVVAVRVVRVLMLLVEGEGVPERFTVANCLHILLHNFKTCKKLSNKKLLDMRNLFLLLLLLLWLLRHLLPRVEPRPELDVAALGLCVGLRLRSHRSRKDGHGAEQEQRQELQRNLQKRSREIDFYTLPFTACKGILEMRNIFKRLRKKGEGE